RNTKLAHADGCGTLWRSAWKKTAVPAAAASRNATRNWAGVTLDTGTQRTRSSVATGVEPLTSVCRTRSLSPSLRRPFDEEARMATTQIVAQMLRKLPVRTDVRTLSLARYVDSARLPSPP